MRAESVPGLSVLGDKTNRTYGADSTYMIAPATYRSYPRFFGACCQSLPQLCSIGGCTTREANRPVLITHGGGQGANRFVIPNGGNFNPTGDHVSDVNRFNELPFHA